MPEYLALNNSRLNQLARKLLEGAKKDPSPEYLYALQLALEGLGSPDLKDQQPLAYKFREDLQSRAYQLLRLPPEQAMWYVLDPREEGDDLEESDSLMAKLLEPETWEQAALRLVERLHDNLGQEEDYLFGPATED